MSDPKQIEMELATLNIANSKELMDQAKNADGQVKLQEKISESVNKLGAIKEVLEQTSPDQVTETFGNIFDRQLAKIGVTDFGQVDGLESLGYTLSPKDYLSSRIAGIEGFLDRLNDWGKRTINDFFDAVTDKMVIVKEGNRSLERRVNKVIAETGRVNPKVGAKTIQVGRYARLLSKDGKIPVNLNEELLRVSRTVTAITTNYYRTNQANTNELISFFGKFNGLSEPDSVKRLLTLPSAVSRYEFREAMQPIPALSDNVKQTKGSVTMLGGRRFFNSFLINRQTAGDLSKLQDWITDYKANEQVRLGVVENSYDEEAVFASLGQKDILAITKTLRSILAEMQKLYDTGDTYLVGKKEYMDMIVQIKDNDWCRAFGEEVLNTFTELVLSRNNEQIQLRTDVTGYLTLLMNAVLSICELSLEP